MRGQEGMKFLEIAFNEFNVYKEQFRHEKIVFIFNTFLISCILIGLTGKFIISQTFDLTSDTVLSGTIAMEFFVHHNYFMTNFYQPVLDPWYFTEILPFHAIPQLISNYHPAVLKSVEFVIFCLTILVFSILIYKISKNITNSLIFAALVSNLPPLSYWGYAQPSSHVSTILVIGIILLLLYDFPNVKKRNYAIALVLLILIAFSDSIIIPWLVAPGLIYYFYFYGKNLKAFWFVCLSVLLIGIVTFVKLNYIPTLVSSASPAALVIPQLNSPYHFVSLEAIKNNILSFFLFIGLIYHYSFYSVIMNFAKISLINIISLLASFSLLLYSLSLAIRKIQDKFYIFFICSGIVIFFLWVLTDFSAPGIGVLRYLIFLPLLLFAGIAISYKNNDKYFTILIVVCLLFTGFSNIEYIEKSKSIPNKQNYQLIDYLKANELDFGFGSYWEANINTYLSGESIIIRPVFITHGQMTPMRWTSALSWYETSSVNKYFIISQNDGTGFFNNKNVEEYIAQNHSCSQVLKYKGYTIYVFEGTPSIVDLVIYH